jgi:hypothetical protein
MSALRPTRRHWSGNVENVGDRASRAIGWFVLALAVGGSGRLLVSPSLSRQSSSKSLSFGDAQRQKSVLRVPSVARDARIVDAQTRRATTPGLRCPALV